MRYHFLLHGRAKGRDSRARKSVIIGTVLGAGLALGTYLTDGRTEPLHQPAEAADQ